MNIYFGTVVRGAPVDQAGSLFKLDWERKTIVRQVPIVPSDPTISEDPNARGNIRGCKGIQLLDNEVVAADYHTLNIFDRNLNLKRKLSHHLMVGLHEIQCIGSSVWVTSTTLDAALKYCLQDGSLQEQYWPREMPEFQQALNLQALDLDKTADNRQAFLANASFRGPSHLHLNAVCVFRGDVYALFHSKCMVVNLSRRRIVIRDKNLKHAHNLLMEEPGVVFINDTHRAVVRQYDLASGQAMQAIEIKKMPGIKSLLFKTGLRALKETGIAFFSHNRKATAKPLYLRGLALTNDYIFAGFSPATIICIDRKTARLVDYFHLSTDARVCIHGLAVTQT